MNGAGGRRSLAVNAAWGLGGRVFQTLLQVFVTPIVIRLLGAEGYGVVAFGATLFAIVAMLDFAFGPVVQRLLNQGEASPEERAHTRDLVFTLQLVSFALAALITVTLVLGAPFIARHALSARHLSAGTLAAAVMLIGAGIGAQWPGLLYGGGFTALERQDRLVLIRTLGITAQSLGGVLLLWLVAADPRLYLAWLAVVAGLMTLALGIGFWRLLPAARPARLARRGLGPHLRFSSGSLVIGLQTAILTQADKLIVARLAGLEAFAAYAVATFAAMSVLAFTSASVVGSILPRMTQRVAARDPRGLGAVLHRTAQQVALALLPAAATLAAFAQPVLAAWLGRSSPLVAPAALLLPWCLAGVALNGLIAVPFLMEMAGGRTFRVVRANMLAAPVFALACWFGVARHGAVFAAGAFIAVNLGYVVLLLPSIFAANLGGRQYGEWLLRGAALPAGAAVLVATAGRLLVAGDAALPAQLAAAGLTGICATLLCLALLPEARDTLATLVRRLRRRFMPAGGGPGDT